MSENKTITLPNGKTISVTPMLVSFVAMLLGAALLVLSLFTPFVEPTKEVRTGAAIFGVDADEMKISLAELSEAFSELSEFSGDSEMKTVFTVLTGLFVAFAALTVLLVLKKKPIGAMVFGILFFALFTLIKAIIENGMEMPNDYLQWGSASGFCTVGTIILVIGGILMIRAKKQVKQEA